MAEKKVSGRKLDYVEWYHYVMRANKEWEAGFSSEITLLKTEGEYLHMVVRVTDNVTGVRHDGVGLALVEKSKDKGFGGAAPEAYSQALRRAFALHGMGIDMYMDPDELKHWGIAQTQAQTQNTPKSEAPLTADQIEDLSRLGKLLSEYAAEAKDPRLERDIEQWRSVLRLHPEREQGDRVITAMKAACDVNSLPHLMD
jgi:hypothetical protein